MQELLLLKFLKLSDRAAPMLQSCGLQFYNKLNNLHCLLFILPSTTTTVQAPLVTMCSEKRTRNEERREEQDKRGEKNKTRQERRGKKRQRGEERRGEERT
ncbi:hypothetical protein Pcinc_041291 [Petrolisthes cinctipes]|uniref:Uncharacterized protein n=1 Tax=Petrolisthes cinctipes TaxID=88211 RepID=A0AAE1BL43_PETCI|nr:hypothetical protein Pcinc_041291 [Petrolisthes cinctipes]